MDSRHKTITLPIGLFITIAGLVWGGATAWQKIQGRIEATDAKFEAVRERFEVVERRLASQEPYVKESYDKASKVELELEYVREQVRALWRRTSN